MTTTTTYRLTTYDHERLEKASEGMYSLHAAENRIPVYIRRGYSLAESIEFAIIWAKNMVEQYDRRVGHGTGAEGWRAN